MALFLLPFNIITLTCWLVVWQLLRRTAGRLPWGAQATDTPEGFALRLYSWSPLAVAGLAALLLSFAGVFVVAIGNAVMPVSVLVACAWAAVIGGTIWAYRRQHQRARLLTVDELHGKFTMQHPASGRPAQAGPLQELSGITVREHQKPRLGRRPHAEIFGRARPPDQ